MGTFIATDSPWQQPAPEPEESYLARACRLVADHAELFAPVPAPRTLRLLPPAPRRAPSRRRGSRQLTLPLATRMPR